VQTRIVRRRMSVSIPEPAAEGEWLDLGQRVFPDWHAAGLKQYQGAGWTLQALYDYRYVCFVLFVANGHFVRSLGL